LWLIGIPIPIIILLYFFDHHPALFLPRHLIHNSPAISALGLQPPGFDRSFPFPAFKATCLGVGYVVLGKRRLAHRL
jgi:hypothetical protein